MFKIVEICGCILADFFWGKRDSTCPAIRGIWISWSNLPPRIVCEPRPGGCACHLANLVHPQWDGDWIMIIDDQWWSPHGEISWHEAWCVHQLPDARLHLELPRSFRRAVSESATEVIGFPPCGCFCLSRGALCSNKASVGWYSSCVCQQPHHFFSSSILHWFQYLVTVRSAFNGPYQPHLSKQVVAKVVQGISIFSFLGFLEERRGPSAMKVTIVKPESVWIFEESPSANECLKMINSLTMELPPRLTYGRTHMKWYHFLGLLRFSDGFISDTVQPFSQSIDLIWLAANVMNESNDLITDQLWLLWSVYKIQSNSAKYYPIFPVFYMFSCFSHVFPMFFPWYLVKPMAYGHHPR